MDKFGENILIRAFHILEALYINNLQELSCSHTALSHCYQNTGST